MFQVVEQKFRILCRVVYGQKIDARHKTEKMGLELEFSASLLSPISKCTLAFGLGRQSSMSKINLKLQRAENLHLK